MHELLVLDVLLDGLDLFVLHFKSYQFLLKFMLFSIEFLNKLQPRLLLLKLLLLSLECLNILLHLVNIVLCNSKVVSVFLGGQPGSDLISRRCR